jgi:hypothetical protein
VLWLAARRVVRRLHDHPEGVSALTTHLLVPLIRRTPGDEGEPWAPNEPAPPPVERANERPHHR